MRVHLPRYDEAHLFLYDGRKVGPIYNIGYVEELEGYFCTFLLKNAKHVEEFSEGYVLFRRGFLAMIHEIRAGLLDCQFRYEGGKLISLHRFEIELMPISPKSLENIANQSL